MTITYYTSFSGSTNSLTKGLAGGHTVNNVRPLAPVDILNPTFILQNDGSNYLATYLYCGDFGRYYYARTEMLDADRIAIHCKVDPLMSWNSQIKSCTGYCIRHEGAGFTNNYIPDEQAPITVKKEVEVIEFKGGELNTNQATANSTNFVLNVVGGGAING